MRRLPKLRCTHGSSTASVTPVWSVVLLVLGALRCNHIVLSYSMHNQVATSVITSMHACMVKINSLSGLCIIFFFKTICRIGVLRVFLIKLLSFWQINKVLIFCKIWVQVLCGINYKAGASWILIKQQLHCAALSFLPLYKRPLKWFHGKDNIDRQNFHIFWSVTKKNYGQDINRKKNVMRQHIIWTNLSCQTHQYKRTWSPFNLTVMCSVKLLW